MTPVARYERDLQREGFLADAAQHRAVERLQVVYDAVVAERTAEGVLTRFARRLGLAGERPAVRGLYLWGGVGRGKTYLMDLFFEALPFAEKKRLHFHRFMRQVHHELTRLGGQVDPLEKIADDFAGNTRVLCFDEFHVGDITDAMLLGTLMSLLFERGVVLVATSNMPPEDLYRDGLQRARFLPAIEAILAHTEVVNVDSGIDYRLRTLERIPLYHLCRSGAADEEMDDYFHSLVSEAGEIAESVAVEIEGRSILARKVADDVVWFDFTQICDGPRSQNDYIEIAREFHSVLISGVPTFDGLDDQARRFINLVDELYDRNVKLVLSASAPLNELYAKGRLAFEFQRTRSRLQEMQSTEYLGRPHRP